MVRPQNDSPPKAADARNTAHVRNAVERAYRQLALMKVVTTDEGVQVQAPGAHHLSPVAMAGYGAASLTLAAIINAFCITPAFATAPDDAAAITEVVESPSDAMGQRVRPFDTWHTDDAPAQLETASSAQGDVDSATSPEVVFRESPLPHPEVDADALAAIDGTAISGTTPNSDNSTSAAGGAPDTDTEAIAGDADSVTSLDKLADLPDADMALVATAQAEASQLTAAARAATNTVVSTEDELQQAISAIARNESATITLNNDITLTKALRITLPIYLTINMAEHTLKAAAGTTLFNVFSSVEDADVTFVGTSASCLDTRGGTGLFTKSANCNFLFEFRGGTFNAGTLGTNLSNTTVKVSGGTMVTDKTIYISGDGLFELESTGSLVSTAPTCAIEVEQGGYFMMNGGSFTYSGTSKGASAIRCDKGGAFHLYNDASLDVTGVNALYCESGSSLDFGTCYIITHDGKIATGTVSKDGVTIDSGSHPEFSDASIKDWLDSNGYALLTADDKTYYGVTKAAAQLGSVGVLNGIYYSDQAYYDSIKGSGGEDPDPVAPDPPAKCDVTFRWGSAYVSEGGDALDAKVSQCSVEQGKTLGTLLPSEAQVAVPGYRFVGWFDAAGNKLDASAPVQANQVYTARYVREDAAGVVDPGNGLAAGGEGAAGVGAGGVAGVAGAAGAAGGAGGAAGGGRSVWDAARPAGGAVAASLQVTGDPTGAIVLAEAAGLALVAGGLAVGAFVALRVRAFMTANARCSRSRSRKRKHA